jgi:hypothetical protein
MSALVPGFLAVKKLESIPNPTPLPVEPQQFIPAQVNNFAGVSAMCFATGKAVYMAGYPEQLRRIYDSSHKGVT